jgi:purine-binding chemotaxis protein CheW
MRRREGMADEALKTLLCLPGKHRNYAVEFPYAEEICKDMMISLMPCLPGHFAGVCNYKGSIVPVVCQEGSASGGEEAEARQMVIRNIFWASFCIRSHI